MKYAIVFAGLGAACTAYSVVTTALAGRIALTWCAIAFLGLAMAYAGVGPRFLLKRPDGHLPLASYFLFGPYHALNALSLSLFRASRRGLPYDEITPHLVLGAVLRTAEASALQQRGVAAVLDLTAEFRETAVLRRTPSYLSIPLLDTTAPTSEQLHAGVDWIEEHCRAGRTVYVHCALGHGRSATFVAAALLRLGLARTPEEAVAAVIAKRPGVRLHPAQMARLREFALEGHGPVALGS